MVSAAKQKQLTVEGITLGVETAGRAAEKEKFREKRREQIRQFQLLNSKISSSYMY